MSREHSPQHGRIDLLDVYFPKLWVHVELLSNVVNEVVS